MHVDGHAPLVCIREHVAVGTKTTACKLVKLHPAWLLTANFEQKIKLIKCTELLKRTCVNCSRLVCLTLSVHVEDEESLPLAIEKALLHLRVLKHSISQSIG